MRVLLLALLALCLVPGSGIAAGVAIVHKLRGGNKAEAERNLKARAAFLALTKEEQLETILGPGRDLTDVYPQRLL